MASFTVFLEELERLRSLGKVRPMKAPDYDKARQIVLDMYEGGALSGLTTTLLEDVIVSAQSLELQCEQLARDNNTLRANSYNEKLERLTLRLHKIKEGCEVTLDIIEPSEFPKPEVVADIQLALVQELLAITDPNSIGAERK